MLSVRASDYSVIVVFCNLIGGQDELVFDGHSVVIGERGDIIARASGSEEEVFRALVLGTRDYVTKNGFKKVVIGLSGGIDSSLVAVIAVEALGKENVIGVSMPSRYTSSGSITDAEKLSENIGIELITVPIEKPFSAYLDMVSQVFSGKEQDVTEENIQARIRGNILMALSNN